MPEGFLHQLPVVESDQPDLTRDAPPQTYVDDEHAVCVVGRDELFGGDGRHPVKAVEPLVIQDPLENGGFQ